MKNINDAITNTRSISVSALGRGHYRVSAEFYGETLSATTANTLAIDDWNSEDMEKDGKEYRQLRGGRVILSIIRKANYSK